MSLTGILLAGGSGSRMGTDKGMVEFKGKRLAEHALDLLRTFCDELIISTANPEYARFGCRIIADLTPGKGPLSGLESTLPRSGNEWNLVFGCDMPFVNRQLVDFLLENRGTSMGVIPIHGNLIEPVAALYHRSAGCIFHDELALGNYSLYKIILSGDFTLADAESLLAEYPLLFKNLNEPKDLGTDWQASVTR